MRSERLMTAIEILHSLETGGVSVPNFCIFGLSGSLKLSLGYKLWRLLLLNTVDFSEESTDARIPCFSGNIFPYLKR